MGEVAELRDRIEFLEEENLQLRTELHGVFSDQMKIKCKTVFNITPMGAKMLTAMLKRHTASKTQLFNAMYFDRNGADEPDPKIVDVYICKLRRGLEPFGIEIETVWGMGYRMADESKSRVNAILDLDQEPADV